MCTATLEALGLFAHAVHLGLLLLGLVGVGVLLVPGWRETRAVRRRETAWAAPVAASEHAQRVAALRRSVGSGALTMEQTRSATETFAEPTPGPRRDGPA